MSAMLLIVGLVIRYLSSSTTTTTTVHTDNQYTLGENGQSFGYNRPYLCFMIGHVTTTKQGRAANKVST